MQKVQNIKDLNIIEALLISYNFNEVKQEFVIITDTVKRGLENL